MSVTATVVKLLIYFWPFIKEAFFGKKLQQHIKRNKWVVISVIFNIVTLFFLLSTLETTVTFNKQLLEQRVKVTTLETELLLLKNKPPEYKIPEYVLLQLESLKQEIALLKEENHLLRAQQVEEALATKTNPRSRINSRIKELTED